MKVLREYQTDAIDKLAYKASLGKRKLIFQLATGGGKTISFGALIHRYLQRNDKKVLILVHREELLKQARRTLYDWYSLIAETVSGRHLTPANIYVSMVETANNRLKKNPNYFGNVGFLIVDECHIGNFKKLYDYFPQALIIGFTATPISSSKKDPLKNHFEDIVCGIDIIDLIAEKSLVPNRTANVKNIKRKDLRIKNGEFDASQMGSIYSSTKHVENCVAGYEKYCKGQKTIVFNCNINHSKIVTEAFLLHGYNAKHVDGEMSKVERAAIFKWFKETDDAILNNVGIATTGYDEPSIMCGIINVSTMSLAKWLQMCGRMSRPYPGKEFFTIVDMGGNALTHLDWCSPRDWSDIFHNPDKPGGGGVAPIKECCECESIIPASAKICRWCGADNSLVQVYDEKKAEFEWLSNGINVSTLVTENSDKKDYYTLHQVKHLIIKGVKKVDDETAYKLLSVYQDKVREWCKMKDKKYNQWHKDITTKWFFDELEKVHNWKPSELNLKIAV